MRKTKKAQKQTHINIANLSLTKEQSQYNGIKIIFSTNSAIATRFAHAKKKKMNLNTDFISFTKISSKLIKELNVQHKTIKLLEIEVGENIHDSGMSVTFQL